MPPVHLITTEVLLLFLLGLGPTTITTVTAVKFDLATLTLDHLNLVGDAHIKSGSIHLSRDLPVPTSGAGRVLFSSPVRLLHPSTLRPLPFCTYFSFSISNLNPSSIGAGLAFLLSPSDSDLGDAGPFLGLINSSDPSPATFAVEFDTLMDVEFDDINGNHVGVDLNSMVSAQVADLDAVDIELKNGDMINSWIDYTEKEELQVYVSYSTVRPVDPVISFPVDLSKYIQEFMYVGFSGSTQGSTEVHSIDWWSFSATSPSSLSLSPPPPPPPPPNLNYNTQFTAPPPAPSTIQDVAESPKSDSIVSRRSSSSSSHCRNNSLCRQGPAAVAGVSTVCAFFIAVCAVIGTWALWKRITKSVKTWRNLSNASEIVNGPREFTYKELMVSTQNFNSARIIGHGAFGTVYKGIVPETGAMVAVKRCIQNSNGGREEFLLELSIIASLRHRNLVRLQGYCHEKGEILLVYDYMIHGSLDQTLFDPNAPALSWRNRKKVLTGVASALAYLHCECERQVIHRDVKSSNIMIDEGYHARLGDFGLARQIDHDASPDATVTAGTMGYLAPEYLLTGRATEKTDVFSFGAVVLEVTCGRRPIEEDNRRKGSNLVEWVWGLYGEGRLMECVDARLEGKYDEGEMRRVMMVGLSCSSPDPAIRPNMRRVVQVLNGEAEPPTVPVVKPSMMSLSSSTNHQLLMSLEDSVSDYNALGFNNLSMGSSESESDSLRSTLRGSGGGGGGGGGIGGG